jgi:alpha-galactosidase/6-phospho-beta-glucosidase family protein
MAGRKPKLTKELIENLRKALEAGNYIETACDYAGINRATLYRWLTEAEQDKAKPLLRELKDTVTRSRAIAEMRNVMKIQQAAEESWQAAGWWLERSHSKKWGRQQKVELSGVEGSPISISLDAKERLLEIIRQKNAQKSEE